MSRIGKWPVLRAINDVIFWLFCRMLGWWPSLPEPPFPLPAGPVRWRARVTVRYQGFATPYYHEGHKKFRAVVRKFVEEEIKV